MSLSTAPSPWRDVISRAVSAFGTPCYVTRALPIKDAALELEAESRGRVRLWLSMKTHPLAPLIAWWTRSGRGVEVVSEAELATALALGCLPPSVLVNGLAKHQWLGRYALRGMRVHFDSMREVQELLPVAREHDWRVGVRLHAPSERDAKDGRFGGPFGMSAEEAIESIARLADAGVRVESVHFHLGQGPQTPDAYLQAVRYAASVCRRASFTPRFVDCGGGLPSRANAGAFVTGMRMAIDAAFDEFGPALEEVWLEHGRFVLEDASVLAVRIVDMKARPECRYLVCDGGRTNHALAADKGPHAVWVLPERSGPLTLMTVCGPTCMTDDILGRMELPSDVETGDVLVWTQAGAYHLPWETRFSHGLCALVWCDEHDSPSLARRRELPEHWMTPCQ